MLTRVGERIRVLLNSWLFCSIQPNTGWEIPCIDEKSSSGIRQNKNRPRIFVRRCF